MDTPQQQPVISSERTLRDLDLGCRIGFLVLTALLGYAAVQMSWLFSPGGFSQKVFSGMLKGTPLPFSLKIAYELQTEFLGLSIALPIAAAIAAFSLRRPLIALLIISGCNFGLALISVFLGTALMDTFGQIIRSLS